MVNCSTRLKVKCMVKRQVVVLCALLGVLLNCLVGVVVQACQVPSANFTGAFRYHKLIYLVDKDHKLYPFDMTKKQFGASTNKVDGVTMKEIAKVRFVVDLSPWDPCGSPLANHQFCTNSQAWEHTAVIIGTNSAGKPVAEMYQVENGKWEPFYDANKSDMASTFNNFTDVLPPTKYRLKAIIKLLFDNVASNQWIVFHGVAFNQHDDSLYFSTTLNTKQTAAKARSTGGAKWQLGQHVLFRASFAPLGIISDATFIANVGEKAMQGVFAVSNQLYGLHKDRIYTLPLGHKHSRMRSDGDAASLSPGVPLQKFFCQQLKPPDDANLNVDRSDGRSIPSFDTLLLPFYARNVYQVDSPLLSGANFVGLVVGLVLLLLLIIAVDGFIIYSMNQTGPRPKGRRIKSSGIESRRKSVTSKRRSSAAASKRRSSAAVSKRSSSAAVSKRSSSAAVSKRRSSAAVSKRSSSAAVSKRSSSAAAASKRRSSAAVSKRGSSATSAKASRSNSAQLSVTTPSQSLMYESATTPTTGPVSVTPTSDNLPTGGEVAIPMATTKSAAARTLSGSSKLKSNSAKTRPSAP